MSCMTPMSLDPHWLQINRLAMAREDQPGGKRSRDMTALCPHPGLWQ